MAMNNVTYPNSHFLVYNGKNLTYTNQPSGAGEYFTNKPSFTP
jgi:hypothetical protein